jgi:hypothetical protein
METEKGWFNTGADAVNRIHQRPRRSSTQRFFLTYGGNAVIAFLDGDNSAEEPIGNYKEHEYPVIGMKGRFYCSCVGAPQCLFDEKMGANSSYDAWPFSIVQIWPGWTDKEGKEHHDEKKLIVFKRRGMEQLMIRLNRKSGMCGTIWEVSRSNAQMSDVLGDVWEFNRKIEGGRAELAKFLATNTVARTEKGSFEWKTRPAPIVVDTAPLVYKDVLRPKTREELDVEGIDWGLLSSRQKERKQKYLNQNQNQLPGTGNVAPPASGSARVNYE